MGQILVRNLEDNVIELEDNVIERLKARALKTNKSLEQTVRDILTEATKPKKREEILADMDRLRAQIGPVPLDATDLIRQDRDSR
jgi:plasmid stability protein